LASISTTIDAVGVALRDLDRAVGRAVDVEQDLQVATERFAQREQVVERPADHRRLVVGAEADRERQRPARCQLDGERLGVEGAQYTQAERVRDKGVNR
jgi:hypothetical protein